jgi:plasmid maintenance system antidote protein VapI
MSPSIKPLRNFDQLRDDLLVAGMTARHAVTSCVSARACGNDPYIWARMQIGYDIWHAERKQRTSSPGSNLPRRPSHRAALPLCL